MHPRHALLRDLLPKEQWPLLKRRKRPDASLPFASSLKSAAGKADSRVMLILHGLSPNLNASDFYRLAPSELSSWQSVIREVQQQRDPVTLRPLGRYFISFASAEAAQSYQDRLVRLHKLAQLKACTPSGLWQSCVSPHLRSPAGVDPSEELDGFTVTSGTHGGVALLRRRVSATAKWLETLRTVVDASEHGDKSPVVLVRVQPPTLSAADLTTAIRADGRRRGASWDVRPPRQIQLGRDEKLKRGEGQSLLSDDEKVPVVKKQAEQPFLVVCANELEARRFHRHWNQKVLVADREDGRGVRRNVLDASIIKW